MEGHEMIIKIGKFLKESWCIDGECVSKGIVKVIEPNGRVQEGMKFKLSDSMRGDFYVTVSIGEQ